MKKNKMMRLASGLLVAVLITTSTISGTYAKYTTAGTATDKARVAKFGVTITAETEDTNTMFAKEYSNGSEVSVKATEKVVAPGTEGTFAAFDISGAPEVDVVVKYEEVALTLTGWEVAGEFYCPIEITVENKTAATPTTTTIRGLDYTSADDFSEAVATAVEGVELKYDVEEGYDLADAEDDIVISWEWPFEDAQDQDDAKDTVLGDEAATGSASTIKLDVTCRVEQLD